MIKFFFLYTVAQVVLQYTLELILGFLIPYGIIVFCYICILKRIRKTKFGRRVRSEKLILAIVLTFCIFWLPYHIINMVQVCHTSCLHKYTLFHLKEMLIVFAVFHSFVRLRGLCVQRAKWNRCKLKQLIPKLIT